MAPARQDSAPRESESAVPAEYGRYCDLDQCGAARRVNLDAVDHAALQALLVVDEDQRIEGAGVTKPGKARARVACRRWPPATVGWI